MSMESPKNLEDNLKHLSTEMDTLKRLKDKVALRKGEQMKAWLEEVESIGYAFEVLNTDIKEHIEGSNSLKGRTDLNRKLIQILKSVNAQTKAANAISETIQTFFRDLTEGKPQKFTPADLSRYTSKFSNAIDIRGNGTVYKGEFPSGVQIVVKSLTVEDTAEDRFMAEMTTMFETSHKNLVKLYGYCFENDMRALVFEYTTNGSLDMYLYGNCNGIKWGELYNIVVDAAKGLSYLHNGCVKQIIHHDLKASNVLLGMNLSPKLTNFGVTKMMGREKTHVTLSKIKGGLSCAPEMMQSYHLTYKYDVYSFGMLLLEVLGRRRIVLQRDYFPNVIWDMLEKKKFGEILNECGLEEKYREKAMILCMVAFWCIQFNPESRPSMDIVAKMLERNIQVTMPPKWTSPGAGVKSFGNVVYDFQDSTI